MSLDSTSKQFTTLEQCSNGEKRRAEKLSPERRKHNHQLLLTTDIWCPSLEKQIQKTTILMGVSDCRDDFEKLLEKSNELKEKS